MSSHARNFQFSTELSPWRRKLTYRDGDVSSHGPSTAIGINLAAVTNHGRDECFREQRGNLGAEWLRELSLKICAHLAQREQHLALRRPDEEQREISSRGDASVNECHGRRLRSPSSSG